jgi:RNA polymerase sigma-70 factor (ECF subfamily)
MDRQVETDETLMEAYLLGDAEAFERLYARYQGALYRYVRRLLGKKHVTHADEVFQETWLRVVRAKATWKPVRGFRPWLFAIAHNGVMDVFRRPFPETLPEESDVSAEDEDLASPSQDPSPERVVDGRMAGERLLDCIARLPVDQRSAFLLHHEDGLSLEDVAAELRVPFETAKSRLRYALSKLRDCMGSYLEVIADKRASDGN